MLAPHRLVLLVPVALPCLAGCPVWELHPSCADYDLCTTSSGSTSTTTGEPGPPTGEIATVTSAGEATATTADPTTPVSTSTGDPAAPAVVSVMFTPDPLTQVGLIDVDVAAQGADHVRMEREGFPPVELSEGQVGHFHGSIEVLSGLSNGTHDATFVPRLEAVEGTAEIGHYTVALPEAGEEKLWDVIPDDGPGQVEALAIVGGDAIVGFGTVHEGNTGHCYLHRRDLDGTGGDVQILFPEYECTAVDVVTDDATIYVLAMVTGGDGPRWRLASMTWGAAPSVLHTGAKDELARALARSASGTLVACGTGPTTEPLMDAIDGRAWFINGTTLELDYRPPPEEAPHLFDETVTDCKFRGEQLVLVGEVYGRHEDGDLTSRKRPFLIEIDGQDAPHWTVQGLGPGNTTQGGATALALDDEGRAIVALYTCGDMCDPQSELRRHAPGGNIDWQVTLPAEVSVFDVAWSPAGYAIIAGAHGADLDAQFLLQGYLPGTYAPAWAFAKGKQAGLQVAFAALAAPGVVVGGGLGVGGFPAFAFVYP